MVNGMTCNAGYLHLGVRATDASGMRRLILVARQAGSIGFTRRCFHVIQNKLGFSSFTVFGARTMAGFTGLPFPTTSLVGLNDSVAALEECLAHVFMANQTSFSASVPFFVGASLFRGRTGNEGQ